MEAKLLVGHGITAEYCRLLADEIPFHRFEPICNGEICIGPISLKMRVGLHMNRPMQVVMACGEFLKMRAENRIPAKNFKPLNPLKPDDNLFEQWLADWCWCPYPHFDTLFAPANFKDKDSVIFDYAPLVNAITAKGKV